jgi:pimeloyl-ACP methyl ester carboxylesterase
MPNRMTSASSASRESPDWFRWALDQPVETGRVAVSGTEIEWLAWGERGAPGLLLATGNGAHAGWWRHIAPFLAETHRVAAFSWSGMGGSGWRTLYSPELFVAEAMEVGEAAGLFEADRPPVMAGHSFGGILTMLATATVGERLRAAILIDARLTTRSVWGADAAPVPPYRVYPTREEAITRFTLKPRQPQRNRFILDMLAAEALGPVTGGGWTWRADPDLRRKTSLGGNLNGLIARARCPLMFVRGALSSTASSEIWAEHRALAAPSTPFVEIPDAYHHVMIDQPIALIVALRALLAGVDR